MAVASILIIIRQDKDGACANERGSCPTALSGLQEENWAAAPSGNKCALLTCPHEGQVEEQKNAPTMWPPYATGVFFKSSNPVAQVSAEARGPQPAFICLSLHRKFLTASFARPSSSHKPRRRPGHGDTTICLRMRNARMTRGTI